MSTKDYYNTLGVGRSVSQDELKAAYRKLAHEHHPDKGGNTEKFKEINEAYQVLGNVEKRKQYDQFGQTFSGAGSQNGASGAGGFGGFDFSGAGGFEVDLDDIFSSMGDMFGFASGRGARGNTRKKGKDIEVSLVIDFKEAIFGVTKEVSLNKLSFCDHCSGQGAEPGSKIETCQTCGGTGKVIRLQRSFFGSMQVQVVCPDCQGEGKKYSKKCSQCDGLGVKKRLVNLKVKIPAGIDNNEMMRLSGQGEAGVKGGNPGDLYFRIKVKEDNKFKRAGIDIKSQEEIKFSQATLGGKLKVETVQGEVEMKIPEGTQSGTIFKLKGKGVPKLSSSGLGDHLVEVIIKTPKDLSRQQKKILEELGL